MARGSECALPVAAGTPCACGSWWSSARRTSASRRRSPFGSPTSRPPGPSERLILSGTPRNPIADTGAEACPSAPAVDLLLAALAERGWSPDDEEVELPPAPAVGGGTVAGAAPRLAVRIQRPSPDRAVELRRRWPARSPALEPTAEPSRSPAAGAHARREPGPPLLLGPRGLRRLRVSLLRRAGARPGFPAIHRYRRRRGAGRRRGRGGRRADRPGARIAGAVAGDRQLRPRGARAKRPQLVVADLRGANWRRSWCARGSPVTPRRGLGSRRCSRTGSAPSFARSSSRRVRDRARRCRSSSSSAGRSCAGKIDLLCDTPAGALVVDYKTDALGGADEAELAQRYATQRDLYAVAAGAAPSSLAGFARSRRLLLPGGARAHRRGAVRPLRARGRADPPGRAHRAHRRGRFRAHRRAAPLPVLRLPRGRAAMRQSRVAAAVGIIRWVSARLALFAYGSLVSPVSAERTLGRPVEEVEAVRLRRLASPLVAGARQPPLREDLCPPRRVHPRLLPRTEHRAGCRRGSNQTGRCTR